LFLLAAGFIHLQFSDCEVLQIASGQKKEAFYQNKLGLLKNSLIIDVEHNKSLINEKICKVLFCCAVKSLHIKKMEDTKNYPGGIECL